MNSRKRAIIVMAALLGLMTAFSGVPVIAGYAAAAPPDTVAAPAMATDDTVVIAGKSFDLRFEHLPETILSWETAKPYLPDILAQPPSSCSTVTSKPVKTDMPPITLPNGRRGRSLQR